MNTYSQALLVSANPLKEKLYTSEAHFNEKYIAANKIKAIEASISVKYDLQQIRETGRSNYFSFNTLGKISNHYEVYGNDTIATYYEYNTKNQLIVKRTNDRQGFYSHNYEYNNSDKLIRYYYSRDENEFADKHRFKLSNRNIILSENYEYGISSKNQVTRTIINDIGKPYKEETFNYDQFGNLAEYIYRYIITGNQVATAYSYDFYSRIVEIVKPEETILFEYDSIGNLTAEKVYKNNSLYQTKEFLYNNAMLLTAQLIKNEETKAITIIKFTYIYY